MTRHGITIAGLLGRVGHARSPYTTSSTVTVSG